jgi:hypothetical protein
MTPEEEAAADQLAQKQRAAQLAQALQWHPAIAAQAAAKREEAQQQAFDERWPNPRAQLRSAHDELHSAEATLAKHREQGRAAAAHVAERAAGVERAQSEVETARKAQTDRLKDRLAGNGGPVPDGDDPAEAVAMRDAERCRRLLAVAQAALTDIEAEVENAADAVSRAKRQVEECALAVITKTRQGVEAEWSVAQQRVVELQAQLTALRVDTRYSSAHWRPNLRRLLDDPEAKILIESEIKSAGEPAPEIA